MTFYNIIYGILFIAACRQFLVVADTPLLWASATIAILVFNDALNTSNVMERPGAPMYTLDMKILDLFSFLLLSLALIALKPSDNPFGVAPPQLMTFLLKPSVMWLMLTIYWSLLVVWNWRAGIYRSSNWPVWLKVVSHLMALPLLVVAMSSHFAKSGWPPVTLQVCVFIVLATYFLILKPVFSKKEQVSPA